MSFLLLAKLSSRLSRLRSLLTLAGAATAGACSADELLEPGAPTPPANSASGGAVTSHYTAPDGSSSGDGTRSRPWDLATALAGGRGTVQPGDTIWVRGGTYRGAFTSTVSGRSGRPVVVRQYPGERATVDAAGAAGSTLQVRGDYSVFWGLEFTNSDPDRTTSSTSSHTRPNTVVNNADHTRYIHLVIHDGGVGFFSYSSASDVEAYGLIVYNNGWQGPDRGHGHALYVKSDGGAVTLRDNIVFNQFGYGIHAYTNAGSGKLLNIRMEGNVAFNNGTVSSNSSSANILLGGAAYADDGVLRENHAYLSPGVPGTNVRIGFGALRNGSVSLVRNTMEGGAPVLDLGFWSSAELRENTLSGPGLQVSLADDAPRGHRWSANRIYRDPATSSWKHAGTRLTWSGWRSATGLGGSDKVTATAPSGTRVVVRPSAYERGRAHVVVYNRDGQGSVAVDLSEVLPVGTQYEVRNVQNYFGSPVASGRFGGGSITLPLPSVRAPPPVGWSSSHVKSTGTEFHVFVVSVAQ